MPEPGAADPAAAYYHPTVVGDKRVVRLHFSGGRSKPITETVSAVADEPGGAKLVTVRMTSAFKDDVVVLPGRPPGPDEIRSWDISKERVSTRGVSRVESYDPVTHRWEKYDPPQELVRVPAQVGTRLHHGAQAPGWQHEFVVRGIEKVTVPAGTFDAIRVEGKYLKDGRPHSDTIVWHAPRVGRVKGQINGVLTNELVSFTPGTGKLEDADTRPKGP